MYLIIVRYRGIRQCFVFIAFVCRGIISIFTRSEQQFCERPRCLRRVLSKPRSIRTESKRRKRISTELDAEYINDQRRLIYHKHLCNNCDDDLRDVSFAERILPENIHATVQCFRDYYSGTSERTWTSVDKSSNYMT